MKDTEAKRAEKESAAIMRLLGNEMNQDRVWMTGRQESDREMAKLLMKKQKGLKNKLTRLNYQLVWAQMVEKEKSIEKVSEMADRVRSKIKKIEADLERVIGLKTKLARGFSL